MDRSLAWMLVVSAVAIVPGRTAERPVRAATLTAPLGGDAQIAVWVSADGRGEAGAIYGQIVDAAGTPLGTPFRVDAQRTARASSPSVSSGRSGSFVVAWQSEDEDGAGVRARRFSRGGSPLGPELAVPLFTSGFQGDPSVAVAPDGAFLVAWTSAGQDGSGYGVFARLFGPDAIPLGDDFLLSSYVLGYQGTPRLAARPDGGFFAVWSSWDQDGSDLGIFARLFAPDGTPVGVEHQVNTVWEGRQSDPAIRMERDGSFTISWRHHLPDGTEAGVFARRFDPEGNPRGPELLVPGPSSSESARRGAPAAVLTAPSDRTAPSSHLTIGDRVFRDVNVNGIQDAGEPGIAGVTVRLLDDSGALLATTTTAGAGDYLFSGLGAADYGIEVVLPPGYLLTAANQGMDDAADSDVDPMTGRTALFSLAAADATRDAGLVPIPPEHITLGLNQSSFGPGETLDLSALLNNPGDPASVDLYFGVLLPDGDTILYFRDLSFQTGLGSLSDLSTLAPIVPGLPLATPFTLREPSFFAHTFSGSEPVGSYLFFMAAMPPGALADGTADPGEIRALGTAVFDFHTPLVTGDSITTDEDVPIDADVLANDVPAAGESLSIESVGAPSNGTTSVNPDQTIRYQPAPDFHGADSFTYSVRESSGRTASATVNVTVSPVNDPPMANSQSASTEEDTSIPVILTGSDADGDPITFIVVTIPVNGRLQGAAPNLTYHPDTNFTGADSFTFKVNDGTLDSNVATVSITVTPANDPPVAHDQSVSTDEEAPLAITLTGFDLDGDPLTFIVVSGPSNGSLSGSGAERTYTPDPDFSGADSFTFKVNDGSLDSNVATVSITVNPVDDPPAAVDDAAAVSEDAPATAIDVLANDTDPDGGPKSIASVTPPANGTVVITGGGSGLTYQPDPDYCNNPPGSALDTFTYTLTPGDATATVSVTVHCVNDPPTGAADSFAGAVGNTLFSAGVTVVGEPVVTVTGNLLTNDSDPEGDPITAVAETVSSAEGGTAFINSDGTFTFLPGVGDRNLTDTFTYQVTDGTDSSSGTVSVQIANVVVWYVNNAVVPPMPDGRSRSPFTSLTPLQGVSDPDLPGDILFLYQGAGTYDGGIQLEAGQQLVGQPEGLVVNNGLANVLLVAPGGSNPTIANSGGVGITLADGVTLARVSVGGTSGDGIFGNAVNNAAIGANLSVTNTSGVALRLFGGNGTVTFGGSITNTAGRSVEISNRTGGSVTFSGAIDDTGLGILLTNNAGATFHFTSGAVQVATSSTAAFSATGGGTVNVTGAANTLSSTASALNVTNTMIGASGLTFRSIASNGGSAPGIVLDNTGTSGGLSVTGTGTAGSGGTIANKTGADGSTTQGIGIYLNNTRNVSLSHMQINDHQNFAIRGFDVTGFTLADSVVSGANGTSTNDDEGSIRFDNLLGSASISNSTVSGGLEDNIRITNTGGVLDRLTVSGSTIQNNHATSGRDGILFEADNAAAGSVMNVTIENSTFAAHLGNHFWSKVNGTSSVAMDVVFTNNTLTGGHPSALGQGILIASASSADVTMDVAGNTINGAIVTPIILSQTNSTAAGAGISGAISNNTIGTSGVAGSGSAQGGGISMNANGLGDFTVAVTGNTIRQYTNGNGIGLNVGDTAPNANVTITGNVVKEPGTFGLHGIDVNVGITSGSVFTACVDLGGAGALENDVVGAGVAAAGGFDLRFRQRNSSTVRLPGYTGGATDTAAVTAYAQGRNTGNPTVSASTAAAGGGFIGGPACAQP